MVEHVCPVSILHWAVILTPRLCIETLYRQVKNSTFPIFATSVYVDQNLNRGKTLEIPGNSTATHISNFKWENIHGTINSNHPGDGSYVLYNS